MLFCIYVIKDCKLVRRPIKKDLSNVKLDYFNEGTNVVEGFARAGKCVDLGYKGEDASGYIMYEVV